MRYAIVENEIIVNVIVADETFIKENYPDAVKCDNFGIGDKYVDGEFILNQTILSLNHDETISE